MTFQFLISPQGERIFAYVTEIVADCVELPIHDGGDPALTPYAESLTDAIEKGIVTKNGKYAIQLTESAETGPGYEIFHVSEPPQKFPGL